MHLLLPRVAFLGSVLLVALVVACGTQGCTRREPVNLLIIVADDVGTDRVGIYAKAPFAGRTPNIDRLGREGLVFQNFWAMPACSTTRAALLTGRLPRRTGIGVTVGHVPNRMRSRSDEAEDFGLSEDEDTIPRALKGVGYASALVGKWHLGTHSQGFDHPLRMGFDHHRGSFGNLGKQDSAYFLWAKLVDGKEQRSTIYATTDTTDEAISLAAELPEPWLIVVSYNAAHGPGHIPPRELFSYPELTDPARQSRLAFLAMVEAMDTEIGRLLQGVASFEPFIFFLGDNGTPEWAYAKPRKGRGKSSLYESNLRVPFIVHHPSIASPGRRVDGLASVTDLFATLLDLSGAEATGHPPSPDSVSLTPYFESAAAPDVREGVVAERFWPNGLGPYQIHSRAARDRRYKLMRTRRGKSERFYDLAADPGERAPVPIGSLQQEQREAYARLAELLEDVRPQAAR